MTRQNSSSISDDHGFLITPRALTSVATIVGLVYTLHAPVRYVLHVGETVNTLTTRVAILETELDQQRGAIAAELAMLSGRGEAPAVESSSSQRHGPGPRATAPKRVGR